LQNAKWSDGKKKKGVKNHCLQNNNLLQDSDGNEENGYPVLDSNKRKINDNKKPSDAHKNTLEDEILQVIKENFMEMILDMVNENVQAAPRKFQDTKNKEYEKT
jgi:triacylglycerol esterase/lipase EstA (alpha/beta hydrolase family)